MKCWALKHAAFFLLGALVVDCKVEDNPTQLAMGLKLAPDATGVTREDGASRSHGAADDDHAVGITISLTNLEDGVSPGRAEFEDLLCQTQAFFASVLEQVYPNSQVQIDNMYWATGIYFEMRAQDVNGVDIATATLLETLTTPGAVDVESYKVDYVWSIPIFSAVAEVTWSCLPKSMAVKVHHDDMPTLSSFEICGTKAEKRSLSSAYGNTNHPEQYKSRMVVAAQNGTELQVVSTGHWTSHSIEVDRDGNIVSELGFASSTSAGFATSEPVFEFVSATLCLGFFSQLETTPSEGALKELLCQIHAYITFVLEQEYGFISVNIENMYYFRYHTFPVCLDFQVTASDANGLDHSVEDLSYDIARVPLHPFIIDYVWSLPYPFSDVNEANWGAGLSYADLAVDTTSTPTFSSNICFQASLSTHPGGGVSGDIELLRNGTVISSGYSNTLAMVNDSSPLSVVEFDLAYGFFAGIVGEPDEAHYETLLCQTLVYLTSVVADAYQDVNLTITNMEWQYTAGDVFPAVISFQVNANGGEITAGNVLSTMGSFNLEDYIKGFLWSIPAPYYFHDVSSVSWSASEKESVGNPTGLASNVCFQSGNSTRQVEEPVIMNIKFAFVDAAMLQAEPTDLMGLLCSTEAFLSDYLLATHMADEATASVLDYVFDNSNDLPVTVSFVIEARDANGIELAPSTIVDTFIEDAEVFMKQYVVKSEPQKENIFYQVGKLSVAYGTVDANSYGTPIIASCDMLLLEQMQDETAVQSPVTSSGFVLWQRSAISLVFWIGIAFVGVNL